MPPDARPVSAPRARLTARRARPWVALGCAVACALSVAAQASGRDDDRAAAEAAMREVEGQAGAADLAKEPLARAREALDRARRLRDVRDEPRARLADGLARTWAEAARDLVRAAAAEARVRDARVSALDAGAQAERERALLEEGIGQAGRLRAQIAAAEGEAKRLPERTTALAKDGDAGARPAPAPKPPTGKRR